MSYKDSEVYEAHEKIGFPKIDKLTQCQLLVSQNYDPIINLIPDIKEKEFPLGLLHAYITISKDELKEYLKQINYIQHQLDSYTKTYDGLWLRKVPGGFEFLERERGIEFWRRKVKTENEVLDIYCESIGWCCK